MSMDLMVKAMKMKVGNPLRKLVLLKLADNASDAGECWPSYQHIADQCEIARSTVKSHIRELEMAGLLRREFRRKGDLNQSNLFHLTLDGGAAAAPRTSHSSEPVKEPVKSLGASAPCDGFEAAWKAYPKREGSNPKNKALSCWKARIKEGVTPEQMLAGVAMYAAFCRIKGSIGTGYVMQAVRFFGTERAFDNDWSVAAGAQSKHHGLAEKVYGAEAVTVGGL